jgi:hypothetical protein
MKDTSSCKIETSDQKRNVLRIVLRTGEVVLYFLRICVVRIAPFEDGVIVQDPLPHEHHLSSKKRNRCNLSLDTIVSYTATHSESPFYYLHFILLSKI